jgi:FdhD protein
MSEKARDSVLDVVAVEEPMEIRVEWAGGGPSAEHRVAVTMRTPGDDFELAAGFLFTEGIVHGRRDIAELRYCGDVEPQEYNVVTAWLRDSANFSLDSLNRNFYTTSSCGVCGKASLDAVEVQGCCRIEGDELRVEASVVRDLPGRLLDAQAVFDRTGGIHAAGLFDPQGSLVDLKEDVGRHNAVDKVIGAAMLKGRTPLRDRILVVSGRSSFEIVQKATMAGIPMVVAVGAPSSLAVDVARRFNVTLIGFAKSTGFNVYQNGDRVEGSRP